eukprot:TRINITY_DN8632_c0_g1_i1.p2 TRINITY_DN8632_c0_g1~~TRINITY_DN8632_c0_g1_i1.p2  ORF type:complete len:53 (-),score=2.41 TRINITY_DN8632_c0_g1_i1:17-175(-)
MLNFTIFPKFIFENRTSLFEYILPKPTLFRYMITPQPALRHRKSTRKLHSHF